jgi:hypothetical protein
MRPFLLHLLLCLGIALPAAAARADTTDTEHMFGFSEGTDIGVPFQPEAELETIGRVGKQAGSYSVITSTANLKYPLSPRFRIAPGISFAAFNINGVPDFDDTNQFAFDHAQLEFRWHPIARETHPIGVTFAATPFYGPVDPVTGEAADNYGLAFTAAFDRTVIEDQLYAAVNLAYVLDRTRTWSTGLTTDTSLLVPSVAATARILPWLYVGAEVRYLLGYDGLALQTLTGQALYVGPTFFITLGKGASLSGAWEPQVWGQSNGPPTGLDDVQFDRQQFKLRLAVDL